MAQDRPDAHALPTPRSTLQARYVAVLLTCRSCLRNRNADLEVLVAGGRGDMPRIELRWRCSHCRSRRVGTSAPNMECWLLAGWRGRGQQDAL